MIKIETLNEEYVLQPTMFSDNTSQIWKLPDSILKADYFHVHWYFENEREIFDLYSFRKLVGHLVPMTLFCPYIPFARQDKEVSNTSTFNLHVFADLLNGLHLDKVRSFDVHSNVSYQLIHNFENIRPNKFHAFVIKDFQPDYLCFPDDGAMNRYYHQEFGPNVLYGEKVRDQATGNITDYDILSPGNLGFRDLFNKRVLILDDLIDGGMTFILAAKALRGLGVEVVGLAVSHGIFSKGKEVLSDAGITKIYTTNSLLKNKDGYEL